MMGVPPLPTILGLRYARLDPYHTHTHPYPGFHTHTRPHPGHDVGGEASGVAGGGRTAGGDDVPTTITFPVVLNTDPDVVPRNFFWSWESIVIVGIAVACVAALLLMAFLTRTRVGVRLCRTILAKNHFDLDTSRRIRDRVEPSRTVYQDTHAYTDQGVAKAGECVGVRLRYDSGHEVYECHYDTPSNTSVASERSSSEGDQRRDSHRESVWCAQGEVGHRGSLKDNNWRALRDHHGNLKDPRRRNNSLDAQSLSQITGVVDVNTGRRSSASARVHFGRQGSVERRLSTSKSHSSVESRHSNGKNIILRRGSTNNRVPLNRKNSSESEEQSIRHGSSDSSHYSRQSSRESHTDTDRSEDNMVEVLELNDIHEHHLPRPSRSPELEEDRRERSLSRIQEVQDELTLAKPV